MSDQIRNSELRTDGEIGQVYRTSHGAVRFVSKRSAMMTGWGKPKKSEENPLQCHTVHRELYVKSPEEAS
jgi:hypothetical protein